VPVGVTDLALDATATDRLGSQTAAVTVHLVAIPDPGTTAVGRVLDADGHPVVDADVRCVGVQGLAGVDGSFSIPGVPTVQGVVQCVASGGDHLSGRSVVVPAVIAGTTDVGDLILGRQPLYPGPKSMVSDRTVAIAAGDFDRDGVVDLAAASPDSPNLSVLRGQGDGTFQAEQRLDLGGRSPQALVTTDINGDGKLDLAAAGGSGAFSGVTVLLGNGDGSFQPPASFLAGAGPRALVTADFNHDGHPDFATANAGDGYGGFEDVSVLLGNGDGTFGSPQSLTAGARPGAVATGDFNGDGTADLVAANFDGEDLSLLLSNGNGTFQAESRFGTSLAGVSSVAVADFNGDGRADVAATMSFSNQVVVFFGNGDGTFQQSVNYETGSGPVSVSAIDLNGDGHVDLATRNFNSDDLSVLLGTDTGSFLPERRFDPGAEVRAMAFADLNRDRVPDFIAAVRRRGAIISDLTAGQQPAAKVSFGASSDLAVFLGKGDGTPVTFGTLKLHGSPASVAIGDLDHDGVPDVVTANDFSSGGVATLTVSTAPSGDPDGVSVLLGHGDGTFKSEVRYDAGRRPRSIALADFNQDGHLDLTTANAAGYGGFSDVSILLGNGNGTFQERQSVLAGEEPWQVKTADLNGDGHLDLLVPDRNNGQVNELLGNGDGTFQPQSAVAVGFGFGPMAVALGDFNHDSALDFVVTFTTQLAVVLGNGDGTFQAESRLPQTLTPVSVTSADLNGDNHADLVVSAAEGGLWVLLGNGDGTFQTAIPYNGDLRSQDVTTADVDRDGKLDLVAVDDIGDVAVLVGVGDGTFLSPQRYSSLREPVALAVADLDRDGAPDVVVANHEAESLSILTRAGGSSGSSGGGELPPELVGSFRGTRLASLSGPVCAAPRPAAWLESLEKQAAVWFAERSRAPVRAAAPAAEPAAELAARAGRLD
jgi:hypothetical protein